MDIRSFIRNVPDFPVPGIAFKDLSPLWGNERAFSFLIGELARVFRGQADVVAGIESRGFIVGGALARELGAGFVPLRKQGKLPGTTLRETYEKEYGRDVLEIQEGAVKNSQRVLVVDDLLATGGTAAAAGRLVKRIGCRPAFCFVVELAFLKGRGKLDGNVFSLLTYEK